MPFQDLNNYSKELQKSDFDGTLIVSHTSWIYKRQLEQDLRKISVCKEIFMMVPSVIYYEKNFYLMDTISAKIEMFKESGLIQFWQKKVLNPKSFPDKDTNEPEVLELLHFFGSFQVLSFGLALSTVAFIFELIRFYLITRQ